VLWLSLGSILAQKLGQKDAMMFDQSQPQIQPNMAQIILSKPLLVSVYCLDVSRDDEMKCECPWVAFWLRSWGKKMRCLIKDSRKSNPEWPTWPR
jgi:hypothetical protein